MELLGTERFEVGLVGKGKQGAVAAAIAKGRQVIVFAVGKEGQQAVHLLGSVAVLRQEMSGEHVILDGNLRAHHAGRRQEGLHPVLDGSRDDDHGTALSLRLPQRLYPFGAQDVPVEGVGLLLTALEPSEQVNREME